LVRTATRVFGGVSGDVMGAAIELSLATLLVVLSSGLGQ
jgi:adenosylcobinamide-GDP ribazoletransferase